MYLDICVYRKGMIPARSPPHGHGWWTLLLASVGLPSGLAYSSSWLTPPSPVVWHGSAAHGVASKHVGSTVWSLGFADLRVWGFRAWEFMAFEGSGLKASLDSCMVPHLITVVTATSFSKFSVQGSVWGFREEGLG